MPVKKKQPRIVEVNAEVRRKNVMDDITNFENEQFDMTNAISTNDLPMCQVQPDPVKGRILVATSSFVPGDLIFKEKAFVSASWNEFHCIECFKPHKPNQCPEVCSRYPKALRENLSKVENALADIPVFGDIDRARCFIKCLLLISNSPDASPLQDFLTLDTNFEKECVEGIETALRKQVVRSSNVIPSHIPKDIPARILSILKCNSHEIEDVGGSGVFLQASMMEHSCVPNCNFVTETDYISVIAIKPIQEGDALSIDYSQAFYRPTEERQNSLLQSHSFQCTCPGCTTLPDRCRSFNCPRAVMNRQNNVQDPTLCLNGIVSPIGLGKEASDWKCLHCNYQLSPEEIKICLDSETRYPAPDDDDDEDDDDNELGIITPPQRSLEEVDRIIREGVLTDAHYSIFWSLIKLGHYLAKQASQAPTIQSVSKKKKALEAPCLTKADYAQQAISVWKRVIMAADIGIVGLHNDKCNYLDCLAQVLLVDKQIKEAQHTWKIAYEMSNIVCGHYTKPTLQLRRLAKNPPRTVQQLMFHYQNVANVVDKVQYDEDHESAAVLASLATSTLDDNALDSDKEDEEEDDNENNFFTKNALSSVASSFLQKYIPTQVNTEQQTQQPKEETNTNVASTNSIFGKFSSSKKASVLNFEDSD